MPKKSASKTQPLKRTLAELKTARQAMAAAAKNTPPAAPQRRLDGSEWGQWHSGWANTASGLGTSRDRRQYGKYKGPTRLTPQQQTNLFIGDGIMRRGIEMLPKEMLRAWITIPDDTKGRLEDHLTRLKLRTRLKEALSWARLYGGSIILMGANDNRALARPMKEADLSSVDYLTVFTCHEARPLTWYADPFKEKFGEVETYELWPQSLPGPNVVPVGQVVHETRVLRFDGAMTPRVAMYNNGLAGWGSSVADRVYEVVRDCVSAYSGIGLLLTDFVQDVYGIAGLADKIIADSAEGSETVLARLEALELVKGVAGALFLDAELETYARMSPQGASGLAELLDRVNIRVAMEFDVPVTRLWGTSPGGMNATGEHDEANYFNSVSAEQEETLRPPLARVLYLVARSYKLTEVLDRRETSGQILFDFNPLWQASDEEKAQAHKTQAEADAIYKTFGLTNEEILKSRFQTGRFSLETALDPAVTTRDTPVDSLPTDPNIDAKANAQVKVAKAKPAPTAPGNTAKPTSDK